MTGNQLFSVSISFLVSGYFLMILLIAQLDAIRKEYIKRSEMLKEHHLERMALAKSLHEDDRSNGCGGGFIQ